MDKIRLQYHLKVYHNIIINQNLQMQQKSKRQLLDQRLDRIKKNSQILINKMDAKINSMEEVKKDLDGKSQRMTNWTNQFQNLMTQMAQKMLGNPLIQNSSKNGFIPKRQTIKFVCQKIIKAKTVCILTGAGVSQNIGIPTFRGKDGLYSKNFIIQTKNKQSIEYSPQQFLTLKTFNQYPEQIWDWCYKIKALIQTKNPGPQHQLINQMALTLKRLGIEVSLVTTNIDSLHKKLTQLNKQQQKYELNEIHGNFRKNLCSSCLKQYPSDTKHENFECPNCQCKLLRPFIMFFDQRYDNLFDPQNIRQKNYDITIVIGSSLATGLSIKIVSNSKSIIQINPKCVLQWGQVYQFENQCQQVLSQLLLQLKMIKFK